MEKVNVLTICPSRGRPEVLRNMIRSFQETSSPGNKLLVYLNDDDLKLPEYAGLLPLQVGGRIDIGPRKFIAEVYNQYATGFEYYAPINDDHFFITPQWDKKLIDILEEKGNGWGIAMADDKLTDWDKFLHPSGCIVSGKMVETLGYMIYPKIQHIGIDVMLMRLCKGIDRLFPTRDVVIEHRHWINGKRTIDDNYKWVYGDAQQAYGNAAVKEYLFQQYEKDVEKIKQAMRDEFINSELGVGADE